MPISDLPDSYAKLLKQPYTGDFSFSVYHSVILDQPISVAFPVLAAGDNIERVIKLGASASDFELLHRDSVLTLHSAPLAESRVRMLDSAPPGSGLPRQFFRLEETIGFLFGAVKTKVVLWGCQTWDEQAKTALYETVSDRIMVWKLRKLEEVEVDGKLQTRVSETVKGICSPWLRFIVETEARKGHNAHLNSYHTLFQ